MPCRCAGDKKQEKDRKTDALLVLYLLVSFSFYGILAISFSFITWDAIFFVNSDPLNAVTIKAKLI